uniref:SWIM-type domain-containing protein n=1 Tax=Chromera velia CCMP2878 TaxID=1169474 RepID=A0A0G4GY97_9ALVE|eukprot:Cvel_23840.t1-p1 / transcript=Cvel_23840.t1 / gene=Cvel_23840 / organism=Chromera_velia_CCMP2878 / gene_product=hypothetical protein / transcript_product=hypothetical protein / location=Cvel_scaffold2507:3305-19233(+) / protein_length=3517 / sequence_SO=supercontig / SO=protein_coding / is_pseudo=false
MHPGYRLSQLPPGSQQQARDQNRQSTGSPYRPTQPPQNAGGWAGVSVGYVGQGGGSRRDSGGDGIDRRSSEDRYEVDDDFDEGGGPPRFVRGRQTRGSSGSEHLEGWGGALAGGGGGSGGQQGGSLQFGGWGGFSHVTSAAFGGWGLPQEGGEERRKDSRSDEDRTRTAVAGDGVSQREAKPGLSSHVPLSAGSNVFEPGKSWGGSASAGGWNQKTANRGGQAPPAPPQPAASPPAGSNPYTFIKRDPGQRPPAPPPSSDRRRNYTPHGFNSWKSVENAPPQTQQQSTGASSWGGFVSQSAKVTASPHHKVFSLSVQRHQLTQRLEPLGSAYADNSEYRIGNLASMFNICTRQMQKAMDIAVLEDGVMEGEKTTDPAVFSVWSDSANSRHVDMDVCECSCPNAQFVCSHLLAVVSALPVYRMKFALVTLAKIAMVKDKRQSSLAIAHHVLNAITHWFPTQKEREELAPAAVWAFVGLLWRFFQKSGDVPIAIQKDEREGSEAGDEKEVSTANTQSERVERMDILKTALEVFREIQEDKRGSGQQKSHSSYSSSSLEPSHERLSRLANLERDVCRRLGKSSSSELSDSLAGTLHWAASWGCPEEDEESLTDLTEYLFGFSSSSAPLNAAARTAEEEEEECKQGEGEEAVLPSKPASDLLIGSAEKKKKEMKKDETTEKKSAEVLRQEVIHEAGKAAAEGLNGLSLLERVEQSVLATNKDKVKDRVGRHFSELNESGRSFTEFLYADEREGGAGGSVREALESAAFADACTGRAQQSVVMSEEGSLPLSSVFGLRLKRLLAAVAMGCGVGPADLNDFCGVKEGSDNQGVKMSEAVERFCSKLPLVLKRYFALEGETDGERETVLNSVGIPDAAAAVRLAAAEAVEDGPVPVAEVLAEEGTDWRRVGGGGGGAKSDILKVLKGLAPLEDIEEGTCWSLRFKERLGPLREFLRRHGREVGRQAIETTTGRFALLLPSSLVSVDTLGRGLKDRHPRLVAALLLDFLLSGKAESLRTLLPQETHQAIRDWDAKSAAEFLCDFVALAPEVNLVTHRMVVALLWRPLKERMPGSFARACVDAGRRAGARNWTHRGTGVAPLPARLTSVLSTLSAYLKVPEWGDLTAQKPEGPLSAPQALKVVEVEEKSEIASTVLSDSTKATGTHTAVTDGAVISDETPRDSFSAMSVVESIRRHEFGVGVMGEGEGEASIVFRSQRDRLTRALKRLSEDMYSGEIHLMMELIQNADDNRYAPGVTPTMAFLVTPKGLVAFTNETGFSEADFRAICDIGKSTKVKLPGKGGDGGGDVTAIGKFGVGFKSVFSLSDSPHLFSAGFSIKFEAHDPSGIGYILPHWVSQPPEAVIHSAAQKDKSKPRPVWVDTAPPRHGTRWTTTLWLPAKVELLDGPGKRWETILASKMTSLSAFWLLFLRKVSVIWVHSEMGALKVGVSSGDGDSEVVQSERDRSRVLRLQKHVRSLESLPDTLRCRRVSVIDLDTFAFSEDSRKLPHLSFTESWMVVPSRIQVPSAFGGGKTGQATVTTLEVALPLGEDGGALPLPEGRLQQRDFPVFAYLPLRSFGFRFVLQGNFRVPASRESVIEGDSWNEFLREAIPAAFLAAVRACKSLLFIDDLKERHQETPKGPSGDTRKPAPLSKAALSFLRFVPRPGELSEFFAPCHSSIVRELQGEACVLDETGEWRLPGEVRRLRGGTSVLLETLLEKVCEGFEERPMMIHPKFAQAASSEVLETLGVPLVGLWDLMEVVQSRLRSAGGSRKTICPQWVGRFLSLLDLLAKEAAGGGRLSGRADVGRFFRLLAGVPFLPLRNGSPVAAGGRTGKGERIHFEVLEEDQREMIEGEGGEGVQMQGDLSSSLPSPAFCLLHSDVLSFPLFRECAQRVVEAERRRNKTEEWEGDEKEQRREREKETLRVSKELQTSAVRSLERLELQRLTREALVCSLLLTITQRPDVIADANAMETLGTEDAQLLALLAKPAEREALTKVLQMSATGGGAAGLQDWDRRVVFLLKDGGAVQDPWGGAFCWPRECGGPADLERLWKTAVVPDSVPLPRLADDLMQQATDPRDWYSFLRGQLGKGCAFFPHMRIRMSARWVDRRQAAAMNRLEDGGVLVDLVQDPSKERALLVTVNREDLEAACGHPATFEACIALDGEMMASGLYSLSNEITPDLAPPSPSVLSRKVGWRRAALINAGCLPNGDEVHWEDPTSFHLALWFQGLEDLLPSSSESEEAREAAERQERVRDATVLMLQTLTSSEVWAEVEPLLSREGGSEGTQMKGGVVKMVTSMAVLLKERKWMPASTFAPRDGRVSQSWLDGLSSEDVILPSLYAPASLFLPSRDVQEVFGSLVPLLPSSLTKSAGMRAGGLNADSFSSVASALSVNAEVSVDALLEVLVELGRGSEAQNVERESLLKPVAVISDSLCGLSDEEAGRLLTPLYEHLAREAAKEDVRILEKIRAAFNSLPLLFSPKQPVLDSPLRQSKSTETHSRRFRKLQTQLQHAGASSVFWKVAPAATSAFPFRPLCELFGHVGTESRARLQSLFVDHLGVLEEPSERGAKEALERVVSGGTVYKSAWVGGLPRPELKYWKPTYWLIPPNATDQVKGLLILAYGKILSPKEVGKLSCVSKDFTFLKDTAREREYGAQKPVEQKEKGDIRHFISRAETARAAASVSLLSLLVRRLRQRHTSSPAAYFPRDKPVGEEDTQKESEKEFDSWSALQDLLGSLTVVPALRGVARTQGHRSPPHRLEWLRLRDLSDRAMVLAREGCQGRWGESGVTPEGVFEQLRRSGLSWSDAAFFLFDVPKVWPVPVRSPSASVLTEEDQEEWDSLLKKGGVKDVADFARSGAETRMVRVDDEGLETGEGIPILVRGWRFSVAMTLSLSIFPFLAEVAQRFLMAKEPKWYLGIVLDSKLREFFKIGLSRIRMVPCSPQSLRQTLRVVFQGRMHRGDRLHKQVVTQPGELPPSHCARRLRLYVEVTGQVDLQALKRIESKEERTQTAFRALSWDSAGTNSGLKSESVSRVLAHAFCGFHFLQDYRHKTETGEETGVTHWVSPDTLDSLSECLRDVCQMVRREGGLQAVEAFLRGAKNVPALPLMDSSTSRLDFQGDAVPDGFSDLSGEEAQPVADFRWGDLVTHWIWKAAESNEEDGEAEVEEPDELKEEEGEADAALLAELSGLGKKNADEVEEPEQRAERAAAWRDAQEKTHEGFKEMCEVFKKVKLDEPSADAPAEDEEKKKGFMAFSKKLVQDEGDIKAGDGEERGREAVAPEDPSEPWWTFQGATQMAVEREDPVRKSDKDNWLDRELKRKTQQKKQEAVQEEEPDVLALQMKKDAPLVLEDVKVTDDARDALIASFEKSRHLVEKKSNLDREIFDDNWRIGRVGELFVLEYLKRECERGEWKTRGVRPVWMNTEGESGAAYDIKLVEGGAAGGNERVVAFIEVKASKAKKETARPFFSVSFNEWMFAQRAGDSLFIYRVYGVESEEGGTMKEAPQLCRLRNPYGAWKRQEKPIYMAL